MISSDPLIQAFKDAMKTLIETLDDILEEPNWDTQVDCSRIVHYYADNSYCPAYYDPHYPLPSSGPHGTADFTPQESDFYVAVYPQAPSYMTGLQWYIGYDNTAGPLIGTPANLEAAINSYYVSAPSYEVSSKYLECAGLMADKSVEYNIWLYNTGIPLWVAAP